MKDRLLSLDALRGFDMLLITGVGELVIALCVALGFGEHCLLARQFEHVEWNGLRLEDTIFPLFLFLAGASWPFSHAKQLERGRSAASMVWRCIRRAALLFLFGLMSQGLLHGSVRMGSVLGRIGVAWLVGALLYMWARPRTLAVIAFVLPIAYWMLMYFVPAPDAQTVTATVAAEWRDIVASFGTGPYSIAGNLSGWMDRTFVPGRLCPYGIADNQSVLGYVPAVSTALFGILAGDFVRRTRAVLPDGRRVMMLLAAATALIGFGLLIAFGFGEMSMPINKKLWSASFTFVVGGYSVAMFALFHWIVDVLGFVRWTFFFRVIGLNSITIYLGQGIVPFARIDEWFLGGLAAVLPPEWGRVVLAVGYVAVCWLFLLFLYRKNTFLRV